MIWFLTLCFIGAGLMFGLCWYIAFHTDVGEVLGDAIAARTREADELEEMRKEFRKRMLLPFTPEQGEGE